VPSQVWFDWLSRSRAGVVVFVCFKSRACNLVSVVGPVCAVTTVGCPVPSPSHAVGLVGWHVLPWPWSDTAARCPTLPRAGSRCRCRHVARARVNAASCPRLGQLTGLPMHITCCLCVHPSVPHPCAQVIQLLFEGPSCRFGGDAAADLSFPPLPPWSPACASQLLFGGATSSKIICACCSTAQCPSRHPHLVPCCLPPSSNFGVCPAPGLLGQAQLRSPITCKPCFLSPIESTLSFAFAYPSPCAPPQRPFCCLAAVGVAMPPRCAASPSGRSWPAFFVHL
jgi:hypothetical protein